MHAIMECYFQLVMFVLFNFDAQSYFDRFLAKSYRDALHKGKAQGNVAYLLDNLDVKSTIDASLSVDSLVSAYKHRAAR